MTPTATATATATDAPEDYRFFVQSYVDALEQTTTTRVEFMGREVGDANVLWVVLNQSTAEGTADEVPQEWQSAVDAYVETWRYYEDGLISGDRPVGLQVVEFDAAGVPGNASAFHVTNSDVERLHDGDITDSDFTDRWIEYVQPAPDREALFAEAAAQRDENRTFTP